MEKQTKILVEADIELYVKDVKEKQHIRVSNIPCVWDWDNGSRESAEYWAVHDWIDNTFGNNLETYWIICVVSQPVGARSAATLLGSPVKKEKE